MSDIKETKKGTVLLASGELDKALLAFEIATGFQAMGWEMNMWFVLYGVNSIRKPKSTFSPSKWLGKLKNGPGRVPETDLALQYIVRGLNHEGASHLPLSQLNYLGLGPAIFRRIMKRKGMAQIEDLIQSANDIGVKFTICQICVDAMAFAVPDDLVVEADVKGVSSYCLEVAESQFNITL